MKNLGITAFAVGLTLVCAAGVLAQTTQGARPPAPTAAAPTPMKGTPIPPALAASKISGVGINVEDLDGMKAWYMTALGMKLVRSYERNGAAYEYILAMDDKGVNGAILALLKGARQPGSTSYGRVILSVPDSEKLAAHFTSVGVSARKVADGAYFIRDPEGNNIEIYTAPK
jgi:catechol 2,3-dioxygenase-like lactoylglutathione lyase family enzyme